MMVDLTGQQPVDPPAQFTGFFRLQDHMEMIRHEAVGENFNRMDLLGLGHQFNEELIVLFRPENFLPAVPPVVYVVDKLPRQSSVDSGQRLLSSGKTSLSLFFAYLCVNQDCPLFYLSETKGDFLKRNSGRRDPPSSRLEDRRNIYH